jgi:hypothetical protein
MATIMTSRADQVACMAAGDEPKSWTELEIQRLLGSSFQHPLITEQAHTACQDERLKVEFNEVRNVATRQSGRLVRVLSVDEANYAAVIIPVLPGGQFVLVGRYRYPLDRWSIEFPRFESRTSDDGWKETAENSLLKGTLLQAGRMQLLGAIQAEPSLLAPSTLVILAEEYTARTARTASPDELIAGAITMAPERLDQRIRHGEISCGVTLAALTLYGARMRRGA